MRFEFETSFGWIYYILTALFLIDTFSYAFATENHGIEFTIRKSDNPTPVSGVILVTVKTKNGLRVWHNEKHLSCVYAIWDKYTYLYFGIPGLVFFLVFCFAVVSYTSIIYTHSR